MRQIIRTQQSPPGTSKGYEGQGKPPGRPNASRDLFVSFVRVTVLDLTTLSPQSYYTFNFDVAFQLNFFPAAVVCNDHGDQLLPAWT